MFSIHAFFTLILGRKGIKHELEIILTYWKSLPITLLVVKTADVLSNMENQREYEYCRKPQGQRTR